MWTQMWGTNASKTSMLLKEIKGRIKGSNLVSAYGNSCLRCKAVVNVADLNIQSYPGIMNVFFKCLKDLISDDSLAT